MPTFLSFEEKNDLKKRAVKYLRYKGNIDIYEQKLIDEAVEKVLLHSEPKIVHRIFDLVFENGTPQIDAKICLDYADIINLLDGCNSCLLIAGTLGAGIDKELKVISKTDMAMYIRMDSVASALIERSLDEYQSSLPIRNTTYRFSPGYGNVPLEMQKELLPVLDTYRKIGLTLTPSLLMMPVKSISGIVGIGKIERDKTCNTCKLYNDCEYRKGGDTCYWKR